MDNIYVGKAMFQQNWNRNDYYSHKQNSFDFPPSASNDIKFTSNGTGNSTSIFFHFLVSNSWLTLTSTLKVIDKYKSSLILVLRKGTLKLYCFSPPT